jgi:hypothetical protein
MTQTLSGGCLCGNVRFEASGTPYRVGLCHCMDCRKNHGALFRSFAIYPVPALRIDGKTASFEYRAGNHRHFCPRCGSPLFLFQDGSDEVEIFLGALDAPSQLTPSYELWTVRREAWLPDFPLARHYPGDRPGTGRTEP